MPASATRKLPANFSAPLLLVALCGCALPPAANHPQITAAPISTEVQAIGQQGGAMILSTLPSRHTGIAYPYSVCVPAGYRDTTASFPVMYMTDGQWAGDLCKVAASKNKNIILVLVHQGPENRRTIDYRGSGAAAYTRFLKEEMVPLIESTYRTNGDRSYYGVSAGGTLGAILLADEPVGEPYFRRYILADGAFHRLTPKTIMQEAERFRASDVLNVSVFVTGSPSGNLAATQAFSERYKSRAYRALTWRVAQYPVKHEEMSYPTFVEAIDTFF